MNGILRSLVVRLGEAASAGLRDPAQALAPIVESLISLRAALRADGHYDLADAVRTARAAADIALRDQPDTTVWQAAQQRPRAANLAGWTACPSTGTSRRRSPRPTALHDES